jgi:DNA-binding NarL/FixJ family response regulator
VQSLVESRSVTVLIVDDQAPFRAAARTVVELTDGFAVVGEAATGEESVEAARRLAPDLILMDVNLPGIDGAEAARRILALAQEPGACRLARGEGARGGPVVVLLSTYEAREYAPRVAECSAAAYLSKAEFGPDALAALWASAGRAGRSAA